MTRSLILALLFATTTSAGEMTVRPEMPNEIAFPPVKARFVRFLIHSSVRGQPCIDSWRSSLPRVSRTWPWRRKGQRQPHRRVCPVTRFTKFPI